MDYNNGSSWLMMQTNRLQTTEDKLNWAIERLEWLRQINAYAIKDDVTVDANLAEVHILLSELRTGNMIDRGIQ